MSGEGTAAAPGGALLLNQPIVIDNGTCSIKTGFAGSSKPKVRQRKRTVWSYDYYYYFCCTEERELSPLSCRNSFVSSIWNYYVTISGALCVTTDGDRPAFVT